jgi:glutamate--cysteine ligase
MDLSDILQRRLSKLNDDASLSLLAHIQRGLEKESLRIDPQGHLAQTRHPSGLGSALSHDYVTTDYSEALLEFITPVSTGIEQSLQTLDDIHRFTYSHLGDELLWGASMPCVLSADDGIPVAEYGDSNVGRMKKVYRHGLGHRYGRLMQTIAGIHYNFSMPEAYWLKAQAEDGDESPLQDYITERYLGLIRNFQRYYWLLIYLFGASPAVCKSFVRDNTDHGLEAFDEESKSLHLPYATALRMGDLGYQSNAQKNLSVCYNQLDSYIDTLVEAIIQPHPAYQEIGLGAQHDRQLNTSLLQIENEFYSPIRPKRVADSGEIALGALSQRGIEYIEVRCVDVNPFLPLGIDADQMRFMDSFLLYCLLQDSPPCNEAEQSQISENTRRVVNRGREPGLGLLNNGDSVPLSELGAELLTNIEAITLLLDQAHNSDTYAASHQQQCAKLVNPDLTPSARILREMKDEGVPFFRLAMNYSSRWAEEFKKRPLSGQQAQHFIEACERSRQQQRDIEASDSVDFEAYLESYYQQYTALNGG